MKPSDPGGPSAEELLFIDVDGTLIRTDLLIEAAFKFVARSPLNALRIVVWTLMGRSILKAMLAREVSIDPKLLPYEDSVIDYIRQRKKGGARILLASASHWRYVKQISDHLGLFDGILASSAKLNLKGKNKARAVLQAAAGRDFTYIGDSFADVPIWRLASRCVLVNPSPQLQRRVESLGVATEIIANGTQRAREFLIEMRIHQWVKNGLIFVPLLVSHSYLNLTAVVTTITAFLCFSLCASGVYFLNDIVDLNSDRHHKVKRNRPLASGRLRLRDGIFGGLALIIAAFALAVATLNFTFVMVLLLYFFTTNAYSFYLKQKATVDVVTLSLLYTVRVVAGAVAINVVISSWLAAFSVFLFISLAYLKRYIEIKALSGKESSRGRGYKSADVESIFILGIANSTASILVFALFINSPDLVMVYNSPEALWGICLLLLYWTNRIWILARRNEVDEDPVVFASKDRISYLVAALIFLSMLVAKYS